MSAFVSALKRLSDIGFVQDACAAVAMCAFILVAGFGLAEIAHLVEAARTLP